MREIGWAALVIFALCGFSKAAPQSDKLAAAPPAQSASPVWVSRPDGATSCGIKQGQNLEDGAKDLAQVGAQVMESRKGSDGKMHIQVCGALTGSQNVYKIASEDLQKAVAIGFQKVTESPKP